MARKVAQTKPTSILNQGRVAIRMALDHLDNRLNAEHRQDLLAWFGRELKRRHARLHAQFPRLRPRRERIDRGGG